MPRFQPSRELHIVVLGAGGVGKSCLTAQFVHHEWIESYDPTIEDTYRTQLEVDGRQIVLEILDTAGTEQFVAMRDLYMKTGQGFLLVFSITSESSLQELETLREEILRIKDRENEELNRIQRGDRAPAIPMVVVGNKADLEDQRNVPRGEAYALSEQWLVPYYETSARTKTNVDNVFVDLCRQILQKDEPDDYRAFFGHYDRHGGSEGTNGDDHRSRKKRKRKKRSSQRCIIL